MTSGETLFLAIVIITFTAFAGVLAGTTWLERDWARKQGK